MRVAEAAEIAVDLERAERQAPAGVRFDQVPTRVEDNLPARAALGVFRHEVGQQRLSKVLVVQRLAGPILDCTARRVHYLPRLRRQGVIRARLQVSRLHHVVGSLFGGYPFLAVAGPVRPHAADAPMHVAPRPCAVSPTWR